MGDEREESRSYMHMRKATRDTLEERRGGGEPGEIVNPGGTQGKEGGVDGSHDPGYGRPE